MECGWIGFCALPAEAQAAWTQALLSVVGIGIAILIPALQSRARRLQKAGDDLAKARAVALTLLQVFEYWRDNLGRVTHKLDGFVYGNSHMPDWSQLRDALVFGKNSLAQLPQTDALGRAAPAVQRFYYLLHEAHSIAMYSLARTERPPLDQDPLPKQLLEAAHAAAAQLEVAHRDLRALF